MTQRLERLQHFQERRILQTIFLVGLSLLSQVLLFFAILLCGHGRVSLQVLLRSLSGLLVQLSRVHTITLQWHAPQNVCGCDTVGHNHVPWQRDGCFRPIDYQESERTIFGYIA